MYFYYIHIQWCQCGNPWERWKARGGVWAVKGINWMSQSVSWNVTAAGVWAKPGLLLCHGQANKTARLPCLHTGTVETQSHTHTHTFMHITMHTNTHTLKKKHLLNRCACFHICSHTKINMLFFKCLHSWKISASYWHFPCANPAFTLSSKSCDIKALIMLNDPISAESISLYRVWLVLVQILGAFFQSTQALK